MFASTTAATSATIDAQAAAATGSKALGQAIAEQLMHTLRDHGNKMRMHCADLIKLDEEGRKQFRVAIQQSIKDMRAHVATREGKKDHELWAKSLRGASVRISEMKMFSTAIDMGYRPDLKNGTYHSWISGARIHIDSNSSVAPTAKRGRVATSAVDKVTAYVGKMELKAADLRKVIAALEAQLPGAKASNVKATKAIKTAQASSMNVPAHAARAPAALM